MSSSPQQPSYHVRNRERTDTSGRRVLGMRLLKPIEFILGCCRPKFMFTDDTENPNSIHIVDDFFKEENIFRMKCHASSTDLNAIKHIWDCVGRAFA